MAEWSFAEARQKAAREAQRLRDELRAIADSGDRPWQELGACVGIDPRLFFPEDSGSVLQAQEVCRGCIVREACLEFALSNREDHGVWGGESERSRRRIRRARAGAA